MKANSRINRIFSEIAFKIFFIVLGAISSSSRADCWQDLAQIFSLKDPAGNGVLVRYPSLEGLNISNVEETVRKIFSGHLDPDQLSFIIRASKVFFENPELSGVELAAKTPAPEMRPLLEWMKVQSTKVLETAIPQFQANGKTELKPDSIQKVFTQVEGLLGAKDPPSYAQVMNLLNDYLDASEPPHEHRDSMKRGFDFMLSFFPFKIEWPMVRDLTLDELSLEAGLISFKSQILYPFSDVFFDGQYTKSAAYFRGHDINHGLRKEEIKRGNIYTPAYPVSPSILSRIDNFKFHLEQYAKRIEMNRVIRDWVAQEADEPKKELKRIVVFYLSREVGFLTNLGFSVADYSKFKTELVDDILKRIKDPRDLRPHVHNQNPDLVDRMHFENLMNEVEKFLLGLKFEEQASIAK